MVVDDDDQQDPLLAANQPAMYAQAATTRYIKPHLVTLETLLPAKLANTHFFFLAIDEVFMISDLLPYFRRLWRECKPDHSWLILIDTNSNITTLAGEDVIDASMRLGEEEGRVVVPPFTYLPFDVHFSHRVKQIERQLQARQLTFGNLVNMLRCFGRPLWYTGQYTLTISNPDPASAPSSSVSSSSTRRAKDKLTRPNLRNILLKLFEGVDSSSLWPAPTDTSFCRRHRILAAAGQRLPLNFIGHQGARLRASNPKGKKNKTEGSKDTKEEAASAILDPEESAALIRQATKASREFLQEQVTNHLRIIGEVIGTGSYVTSTPSEPALSLAVASLFRGDDSHAVKHSVQRWSDVVTELSLAYRSVGLLLGEEGEECVRLLCSMAADLVAAERVQCASHEEGFLENDFALFEAQTSPICLKDWLGVMFGKHFGVTKEIPCEADQADISALLEWATGCYLNFTHYLRLDALIPPGKLDPSLLVEYWLRQAAVCGISNQDDWDILIPIYRSFDRAANLADKFDPDQLSYVVIQVKNCTTYQVATDRFGPSYRHHHHQKTAAAPGANSDSSKPRLLDDCLEIFFDLRATTHMEYRHFTDPRERKPTKKKNGQRKDDQDDESLMDPAPAPAPAAMDNLMQDDNVLAAPDAAGDGDGEMEMGRLRPKNCFNLVVGGSGAKILPVISHLSDDARKDLNVLFKFDDTSIQERQKAMVRAGTKSAGCQNTIRVLRGNAPAHLFTLKLSRKPERGKTGIPRYKGSVASDQSGGACMMGGAGVARNRPASSDGDQSPTKEARIEGN